MLRAAFIGLGLLAWAIAIAFGLRPTVPIQGPVAPPAGSNIAPVQSYEATSITSAAGALGFSVAGGLCFLAASLAERRAGSE
jgi:hypothetical protein